MDDDGESGDIGNSEGDAVGYGVPESMSGGDDELKSHLSRVTEIVEKTEEMLQEKTHIVQQDR